MGGAISNAGNLRRWCERELRIEENEENALSRKAAADDALTVLPFWIAERAPTWPENFAGRLLALRNPPIARRILRDHQLSIDWRKSWRSSKKQGPGNRDHRFRRSGALRRDAGAPGGCSRAQVSRMPKHRCAERLVMSWKSWAINPTRGRIQKGKRHEPRFAERSRSAGSAGCWNRCC